MSITYTKCSEAEMKIDLKWTIPNFKSLLENKTKVHTTRTQTKEFRSILSKESPENALETHFQLKLRLLGIDNNIIEIYCLSSHSIFIKSLRTEFCSGSGLNFSDYKDHQVLEENKWQYIATMTKQELERHNYCTDSSTSDFTLKLKFSITNYVPSRSSKVPKPQLGNNLEFLLNNGLFSDVTMKSADHFEFKVHRGVLASRSAVLKAHFEHNTTECTTNIVETPLESEVLREVLTFIYSDTAPRAKEMPQKLLAAADYYQLDRLKSICEEALIKKLTVENAIETLQLADLHMATNLRDMTMEFIKDGRAKLIVETDSWASVRSIELIKRIYEYSVADDYDITYV